MKGLRKRARRVEKKIKPHVKKIKKRIAPQRMLLIYFLKFIYLTGLTFLILYLFTTERPEQLTVVKATPYILFFVALGFIIVSVMELRVILGTWKRTFRRLALFTLIPGILGAALAIFGEQLFFTIFPDTPAQIVTDYINRIAPKIWILTVAFIFVGFFFYQFSKKFD